MKSSKANVHKEKFNPLRWTHYGIPDWLDYVNPFPEPTYTISKGSNGVGVKWVQWILGVEVDGSCGKKTDKAIRDFQKKHKLEVDGRVGPATRKEMKK